MSSKHSFSNKKRELGAEGSTETPEKRFFEKGAQKKRKNAEGNYFYSRTQTEKIVWIAKALRGKGPTEEA